MVIKQKVQAGFPGAFDLVVQGERSKSNKLNFFQELTRWIVFLTISACGPYTSIFVLSFGLKGCLFSLQSLIFAELVEFSGFVRIVVPRDPS